MITLFGMSVAIEKPDVIPATEITFYIFIAVRAAFVVYLYSIALYIGSAIDLVYAVFGLDGCVQVFKKANKNPPENQFSCVPHRVWYGESS